MEVFAQNSRKRGKKFVHLSTACATVAATLAATFCAFASTSCCGTTPFGYFLKQLEHRLNVAGLLKKGSKKLKVSLVKN